jgi:hypothetical protein
MAKINESYYSFVQSTQDPKTRQKFLEGLDLKDFCKGTRLEYVPNDLLGVSYFSNTPANVKMYTITRFSNFPMGKILWGKVLVYPIAFKDDFTNFMSNFHCHELHHVRQHHSNPIETARLVNRRKNFPIEDLYFGAQVEIPAYLAQIHTNSKWKLEENRVVGLNKIVYLLEKTVKEEAKKLGKDWRKDLSKILCRSPYDDIVRQRYSL